MLALKLLDGLDRHISSRILLTRSGDTWGRELYRSGSTRFAGLRGAAYFGLAETAVALLNMRKWDLSATDVAGNMAILWAARNGHRVVLEVLLEQEGATPNTVDQEGRTPLSLAAEWGHGDVVRILLEREDLTPNTAHEYGRTPLSWATGGGHNSIVETLLVRGDVAPDTPDREGRTPLSWAAGGRHGSIVEILLARMMSPLLPWIETVERLYRGQPSLGVRTL